MFTSVAFFFTDSSESDGEHTTRLHPKTKIIRKRSNFKQRLHQHQLCTNNTDTRMHFRAFRDASNVLELPEEQFLRLFRVNKEVFSVLLDEITPCMQHSYRSTHIPTPLKLAKFLAFIATGIATTGHDYAAGISKSRVSSAISEILNIFEQHLLPKWLRLEQDETEEYMAKQYFYDSAGIPGAVGCVDNMHVQIKKPNKEVKHLYNNYKGFPSLNVMIICDNNMVIKYVDASQPGCYNDAYVWEQSSADNHFKNKYLNGNTNTWLLGDSAYKLLPYMMIPYKYPDNEFQRLFNEKMHNARDIIHQCFAILKNRFGCLNTAKGLYYSPEKATKAIISCCILHNICTAYNNTWQTTTDTLEDIENDNEVNSVTHEGCIVSNYLRDEIAINPTQFLLTELPNNFQNSEQEDNQCFENDIRSYLRQTTNILDVPDYKFFQSFRVNKEIFSMLIEEITPKLKPTYRNTHTPVPIKLAAFLAFLATGGQLTILEQEYVTAMSKSQMSKIITEMLDIFEEHLYGKWIKLEHNQDDENNTKQHFYNSTGIPDVLGCVDNTHILIKTPGKEIKELYYNCKGFYSLNVMMICDHNMVIKYVDANQPGSYQDEYIWNLSSADNYYIRNYLQEEKNAWLIADSAYNLQPYIMTPFRNPVKKYEHTFNQKHFEIRKTIQKCFHVLMNRFKCLNSTTGLLYTPEKATKIINSCCILHNICIAYKSVWHCDSAFEDHDSDDENIATDEVSSFKSVVSIRNEIAKNLLD